MNQPKIKIPSKTNPVQASAPVEAEQATAATEAAPAAPEAPKAPPPSGAEKAALFKQAFAYDDTVTALLKQIEDVKAQKSAAVKTVLERCGKGPFSYRGREITISSRGDTFFFKDYGKHELESIDAE